MSLKTIKIVIDSFLLRVPEYFYPIVSMWFESFLNYIDTIDKILGPSLWPVKENSRLCAS